MSERLEADVIVIGSGIAGTLAAYQLAKKGLKIIVLEAGPRIERGQIVKAFTETAILDYSAGFPNVPWAPRPNWGDSKQTPYIELTGPQPAAIEYLRVVGGTTWHWSSSSIRMLPDDFRMKTNYGVGVDWPISYHSIEPFYSAAEQEIGVAGNSHDDFAPRSQPLSMGAFPLSYSDNIMAAALKKIDIPLVSRHVARNSKPANGRSECKGFGTCSPICPSGAQYAAIFHVEMIEKMGVRVIENARVDRLDADDAGKIISAQVKRSDGTTFTAYGKIFVLAANGIESPRLLMMSTSERYPKGLASNSGQLGRNFYTHPGPYCRLRMPEPIYSGRGPENIAISHKFRMGDFRKNAAAWLLSIENRIYVHEIANDLLTKGVQPPALDAAIRDHASRQLELDAQMEQLPAYENGISLDWNTHDSAGQPRIQLYYSFSDYERAGLTHIHDTFTRIAKTTGAEIISIGQPTSHHHLMGMTRMGKDPKLSVVDADCRTHEHHNLFVLSSSNFPTGGTANPTLTIAALSLRATETIIKQIHASS